MRRLTVLLAAMAAAIVLVSGTALSQTAPLSPTYTIQDLGTLGGPHSEASDVNNSGQVVGSSFISTSSGDHNAFLYSDGQMHDLGTLGGNKFNIAQGINDSGQVVGWSRSAQNSAGDHRAFLYSGGPLQDIGTLGGPQSVAHDINNSGQIVGDSDSTSVGFLADMRAFLYSGGQMHDLGALPGGTRSSAQAINDLGQVVGWSRTGLEDLAQRHAFLYSGGQMHDLGTLPGHPSHTDSSAHDINGPGQVVGWSGNDNGLDPRAFLYSDGQMQDLGAPPGHTFSRALGINDSGQVVGSSGPELGGPGGNLSRAFLYSGGQMHNLNDLIPSSSGWVLNSAVEINNSGQIVGTGIINEGFIRAFLATPVTDTTLPQLINLPADITEEATGPAGAQVSWQAPTATDENPTHPIVSCSPGSGSTFAIGTTTVNCSATDAANNTANGSFTVKVQDTNGPNITNVPSDITTEATSSAGATVTFTKPTASDAVDGDRIVNCSPDSGSLFPIGTTQVNCSATDAAGNQATGSFQVNVVYALGEGTGEYANHASPPTVNTVGGGKAGAGIPVRFSISGNFGLDIFAAGYPTSKNLDCNTGEGTEPVDETLAVSNSGLKYDADTDEYTYTWKTEKKWAGSCRQLIIRLKDGTEHPLNFHFSK